MVDQTRGSHGASRRGPQPSVSGERSTDGGTSAALAGPRPTEYDQFAEALLRVGDGAYLRGDAVPALHHLALVNPRRIRVGVARRVRAALPDFIELREEERPESELTDYEGLRNTTVAAALLDCRNQVMTERLVDAAKQAKAEGLLTDREYARVRRALARETQPA